MKGFDEQGTKGATESGSLFCNSHVVSPLLIWVAAEGLNIKSFTIVTKQVASLSILVILPGGTRAPSASTEFHWMDDAAESEGNKIDWPE